MGAQEYGALCKRHAEELGISQSRLASRLMRVFALEEDEERTYDATTVRLIYDGRRKIDDKLFEKLNQILDIDRDEAEHTLGIWPSELDLDGYRRYKQFLSAGRLLGAGVDRDALTHRLGKAQSHVKVPARLIRFPLHRRPGLAPVLELGRAS